MSSVANLEDAITDYSEALSLHSVGHLDHSTTLYNLAKLSRTRYDQSGSMEDLEEAIEYSREVLSLHPLGHPDRSASLINLTSVLLIRYERIGGINNLKEAITFNREALRLCPPGHPICSMSLSNLGFAVFLCYEQSGRMEDLEEATTYHHEALSLRPPGHPDRHASLNNLALAVLARYKQLGKMEDLEEVITFNREALSLRPPGHPDRSGSLINLGNAVLSRYEQSGRMEDLEEATTCYHEALSLCPPGNPDRPMSLDNLASAVLTRYEQSGKMEDLEEAITYNREALGLCPPGHPDRPMSLNNLSDKVRTRYEHSGKMEDLEEATVYIREALGLYPPGHPNRSGSLINLGNAIFIRSIRSGRMEDLDEATTYYYEALSLRPPDHPERSASLSNLAFAVLTRYKQSGKMKDLEEAITYNREALGLCPPGHPDRYASFTNLGNAVLSYYKRSGRMEDLDEATTYYHKALSLHPLGHPYRSSSFENLAYAVFIRYEQSSKMEDLEEAIAHWHKALSFLPPDHPNCSECLNGLASGVLTRYVQSGRAEDLEESFMLYEQAANHLAASSRSRLTAAIEWAGAARQHHHSSITRAYSISLHLLDRCLISYPNIESQQRFLATAHIPRSLASDAASAAIDVKELEAAAELLEQGRAMLWSKLKGYRYPLDQLHQVNRLLADELGALGVELEHLALSSESRPLLHSERPTTLAHLEAQMQRHRILSEKWEKVLEQIRKIEGFDNFLQAVPFSTLRTAAAEGPVILINISSYRSDAIIIHIDKPPILVALPKATPEHLTDLGEQLASALAVNNSSKLLPILRDLWNHIVSPVCDSLTQLAVPQRSRVWWCPTSQLCALPLHAAGLYEPKKPNFNLHNICTFSYIPTLSALISARSNMIHRSTVPKLLVIGQPSDELPMVQNEIDGVQQLGDFVDVIVGMDASRDAVIRGLQQHSWVHLACHGHMGDISQPFHASFELYDDDRLTLLDLMPVKLPNAEFAFLAACHTAAGDSGTPDETIHLAAALQFCGFPSVVGTLWATADKAGPIVSKVFYKYMFRNPGNEADVRDSAKALNLAIRALWKEGAPLEDWIAFVHIGI